MASGGRGRSAPIVALDSVVIVATRREADSAADRAGDGAGAGTQPASGDGGDAGASDGGGDREL